jgi:hypothetical protein
MEWKMKKIKVILSQTVAMQALMDAVIAGYTVYTSGIIDVPKAKSLFSKFDENYRPFVDRNERARRIRRGLGNTKMVLFYDDDLDKVRWWLLATPTASGANAVHRSEKMKDVFSSDQRIIIEGHELVRVPKKESASCKLTWRMIEEEYKSKREDIIATVRGKSHYQMHVLLLKLFTHPGFAGIRSQIGHLIALYRREVKRASLTDAPSPPTKLLYVRRIPHKGISLTEFVSGHKAGK